MSKYKRTYAFVCCPFLRFMGCFNLSYTVTIAEPQAAKWERGSFSASKIKGYSSLWIDGIGRSVRMYSTCGEPNCRRGWGESARKLFQC